MIQIKIIVEVKKIKILIYLLYYFDVLFILVHKLTISSHLLFTYTLFRIRDLGIVLWTHSLVGRVLGFFYWTLLFTHTLFGIVLWTHSLVGRVLGFFLFTYTLFGIVPWTHSPVRRVLGYFYWTPLFTHTLFWIVLWTYSLVGRVLGLFYWTLLLKHFVELSSGLTYLWEEP